VSVAVGERVGVGVRVWVEVGEAVGEVVGLGGGVEAGREGVVAAGAAVPGAAIEVAAGVDPHAANPKMLKSSTRLWLESRYFIASTS
jgi:hypothetical protein